MDVNNIYISGKITPMISQNPIIIVLISFLMAAANMFESINMGARIIIGLLGVVTAVAVAYVKIREAIDYKHRNRK